MGYHYASSGGIRQKNGRIGKIVVRIECTAKRYPTQPSGRESTSAPWVAVENQGA